MKIFAGVRDALARLSARERLLLGAAIAIAGMITAVYGLRLPGEAAASSASNRNARAAADLAEVRMLASAVSASQTSDHTRLERLKDLATESGLEVLDARMADSELKISLRSPTSVNAVAWAALASEQAAPLRTLSITRQASGLAVEASFPGNGQ